MLHLHAPGRRAWTNGGRPRAEIVFPVRAAVSCEFVRASSLCRDCWHLRAKFAFLLEGTFATQAAAPVVEAEPRVRRPDEFRPGRLTRCRGECAPEPSPPDHPPNGQRPPCRGVHFQR